MSIVQFPPKKINAVEHDELVCGLDPPGPGSLCPACRLIKPPVTQADLDWGVWLEYRLERLPSPLDRSARTKVLQWLFDLERTCRVDAQFAAAVAAIGRRLLRPEGDGHE